MSGQDYPIKSKQYINSFFERHRDTDFISLESDRWSRLLIQKRKDFITFNKSEKRKDVYQQKRGWKGGIKFIKDILTGKAYPKFLLHFDKFLINNPPFRMNLYKGSNWWALQYDSAEKIYAFYKQNKKELDRFFKHFFCSDETFFQSIYAYLDYKGRIKNDVMPHLTYTEKDFDTLMKVGESFLFARKFDENSEILDLIDREIKE